MSAVIRPVGLQGIVVSLGEASPSGMLVAEARSPETGVSFFAASRTTSVAVGLAVQAAMDLDWHPLVGRSADTALALALHEEAR